MAECAGGARGAGSWQAGLQEGVALGAVNVLKDAGTAFADVLDADSPPASPRAGSGALATWQKEIERALREGENVGGLEVLAARQLVGVMLFVLAAPWVKRLISNVAAETCRTGLGGMAGNKGAVAVRMQVRQVPCSLQVPCRCHIVPYSLSVEAAPFELHRSHCLCCLLRRLAPAPVFSQMCTWRRTRKTWSRGTATTRR